jgi:hypothetical protein
LEHTSIRDRLERSDEHTLARLKRLARKRHKGYQTLLKEFAIERLYEEEKLEGLHGTSGR